MNSRAIINSVHDCCTIANLDFIIYKLISLYNNIDNKYKTTKVNYNKKIINNKKE